MPILFFTSVILLKYSHNFWKYAHVVIFPKVHKNTWLPPLPTYQSTSKPIPNSRRSMSITIYWNFYRYPGWVLPWNKPVQPDLLAPGQHLLWISMPPEGFVLFQNLLNFLCNMNDNFVLRLLLHLYFFNKSVFKIFTMKESLKWLNLMFWRLQIEVYFTRLKNWKFTKGNR